MSPPAQQSSQSPQQPAAKLCKRAKVACKSCHRRRVKCDAAESQPCWHCRLRSCPCELIVSRRGKYTRSKTANTGASNAPAYTAKPTSPTVDDPTPQTTHDDTHSQHSTLLGQPLSPPTTVGLAETENSSDSLNEGSEMLYARLAEPDSTQVSLNLFPPNVRSFYMGESFSLAFIVQSLSSNPTQRSGPKLHYPIPNTVAEHQNSAGRLKASDPSALAYLNMYGAFIVPSKDISDKLIRTFFESFHPAFPVFDRQEFCALYQQNQVPILVLQTIYFLSLTICSEDFLRRAGFVDRYSARRTFYLRAKALYDMDYENSKVKLTAILFLLGFWWERPEDQKDTWHWLGAAISLAQTLGMHRSTANSGMSLRHRSLWKRMWWSIYVRDRHAAAALGRPCRIRDEDCDIEMLNKDDFFVDHEYDNDLLGYEHEYHWAYAIEMAKLAIIMGKLLCHECAPHGSAISTTSEDLDQELRNWEINLPSILRRQPAPDSLGAPFWSSMLYAIYYNCEILLCRPKGPVALPASHALFGAKARMAADSITRIAEDLLAAGTLMMGQLHLVPAIFAALSIHALVIRGNDGVQKQLAENRARQCILAMGELAKGWPVAGWILQLFIKLMNRLTGPSSGLSRRASPQREVHSENQFYMNQQTAQSMSNPLSYIPVEGDLIYGGEEEQTDQLMSDIIWAPNQCDLDFDLMFRNTQLNDLFPLNSG